MKFLYAALISLIFCSCSTNQIYLGYKPNSKEIEREKLADEITANVAAKLKQKQGLIPCGFGGRTSNGVQMLALSFDYSKPISTLKGQELLISSVQEFVAQVNAEERIRPYLKNYPFNPKNIEIRIFLRNSNGSKILSGLRIISACGGILEYNVADPESTSFKKLFEETYEEAIEKLNAGQEKVWEESAVAVHV